VVFCALADALLIAAGVWGMAQALGERPGLARALALAGAAFLAVYGWQALRRARQAQQLIAAEGTQGLSLRAVVLQAAAFTLLNPHVYLDTVLLVRSSRRVCAAHLWRVPAWPAHFGLACWVLARVGWPLGLQGPARGRCWMA
jgi:arginine exporter protein ArgO